MSMISEQDLYNAMINHPLYSFAIPYLGYETADLSEEQILYRKKQANLLLFQIIYARRSHDKNLENKLIQQLLVIDKRFKAVKKKNHNNMIFSKEDYVDIILFCLKYGITYPIIRKQIDIYCSNMYNYEKYILDDEIQQRLWLFHEYGKDKFYNSAFRK